MQLVHTPQHTQLSLFEAFMAQPLAPILKETVEAPGAVNLRRSVNCRCAVQPKAA